MFSADIHVHVIAFILYSLYSNLHFSGLNCSKCSAFARNTLATRGWPTAHTLATWPTLALSSTFRCISTLAVCCLCAAHAFARWPAFAVCSTATCIATHTRLRGSTASTFACRSTFAIRPTATCIGT